MKIIKKNLKWITLMFVMIITIGGIIIKYSLSLKETDDIVLEELELKEEDVQEETTEEVEEVPVLQSVMSI